MIGKIFLFAATLASAQTNAPALLSPAAPEVGLVDPFRGRNEEREGNVPGEDGLMRTTMGEISSDFRILAISIPKDEARPRSALIQFHSSDEPILVHEGDLVRVDRTPAKKAGRRPQKAESELEEQLRRFVFYVNVKNIKPGYIEVYHNKKRPDETIRLNW